MTYKYLNEIKGDQLMYAGGMDEEEYIRSRASSGWKLVTVIRTAVAYERVYYWEKEIKPEWPV